MFQKQIKFMCVRFGIANVYLSHESVQKDFESRNYAIKIDSLAAVTELFHSRFHAGYIFG